MLHPSRTYVLLNCVWQHVIPFSRQLEYFKEYQSKLSVVAGSNHARSIISDSLYIISAGSNDFGFNYYINPLFFLTENADQFSDRLVGIFNNTVTVSKTRPAASSLINKDQMIKIM